MGRGRRTDKEEARGQEGGGVWPGAPDTPSVFRRPSCPSPRATTGRFLHTRQGRGFCWRQVDPGKGVAGAVQVSRRRRLGLEGEGLEKGREAPLPRDPNPIRCMLAGYTPAKERRFGPC